MYERLMGMSRAGRMGLAATMDGVLLLVCIWIAYTLQLGQLWPELMVEHSWLILLVPISSIPWFIHNGLYRSIFRYFNTKTMIMLGQGMTMHVSILLSVYLVTGVNWMPMSAFVIYWMLGLLALGGSRLVLRNLVHAMEVEQNSPQRVVVYGAGSAGAELVSALNSGHEYLPVAFVDDKKELHGSEVHGIRVFPTSEIGAVIKSHNATLVLLAIPSASMNRRRRVLDKLKQFPIRVRTVPALADLVSGRATVSDLREVKIEDILGRDSILPDERLLHASITNKSVMVTGAGGSIGSELSRQIKALRPNYLILYEVCEYALYQIDRELHGEDDPEVESDAFCGVEIVPILGTVTDQARLEEVMKTFKVDTVFHAAAYKHVPLVEYNPIEGIKNNVFGTLYAAQAARNTGVEKFILISSDKAVRPTNVMGATKRVAELILQALHEERCDSPVFSMVRFGNVLASSGSVVPLFKEQIARGGPVTVTDPNMTRYFMTIPEAAQLVIQAGSMAEGGDVFVLDMGKPVRIMDLAGQMISLSGLRVWDQEKMQGDIKIVITGQRPGEKLYEERLLGNNISETSHPRILRANEESLPSQRVRYILGQLRSACSNHDSARVVEILCSAVAEYAPQGGIVDKVWVEAMRKNAEGARKNMMAAS